MEDQEKGKLEVIITAPAESFFYELLEYLYNHYSIDRAEEIADELRDVARSLNYQSSRGTLEPRLGHLGEEHRFILYKRTSYAEVKVIYYIDEKKGVVYVTDFFPTEKDDIEIIKRSKID